MQDFSGKITQKITVSRCNFQKHKNYDFNIQHLTRTFPNKNDNCVIFGKMMSQFSGRENHYGFQGITKTTP